VRDPRINLHDIGAFGFELRTFTQDVDFEAFRADAKLVRAVSYCLLAIGEAVFRTERDFPGFLESEVSAELPWKRMIGIRHFLAHGYDRVEADALWKVIEDDLAPLIKAVNMALARLTDPK
jgi:uncharacterized protein with HEPN domain